MHNLTQTILTASDELKRIELRLDFITLMLATPGYPLEEAIEETDKLTCRKEYLERVVRQTREKLSELAQ